MPDYEKLAQELLDLATTGGGSTAWSTYLSTKAQAIATLAVAQAQREANEVQREALAYARQMQVETKEAFENILNGIKEELEKD